MQPATATGLISYWGGIFAEDLMHWKDGVHRWTPSSLPTVAFHGTADTTVSPATGDVLHSQKVSLIVYPLLIIWQRNILWQTIS